MSNFIYKNFLGKKSIINLDLSLKAEFDDVGIKESTHRFMFEYLVPNEVIKKPYFIADVSFSIPQFSKLKFTEEEIQLINERGLVIFLADFIVSYTGDKINFDFKDIHLCNFDNLDNSNISFNYELRGENIHAFSLDSIQDLIDNNDLKNVVVYACDDNLDLFKRKYSNITFKYFDLHTRHWIKNYSVDNLIEKDINFKFSCINLRYSVSRHLLMSYLINYNGNYSWYYKTDFQQLQKNLWFNLESWDKDIFNKVKTGATILNSKSPLVVDIPVEDAKSIKGLPSDWFLFPTDVKRGRNFAENADKLFLNNSFCHIAVETIYASIGSNVGEKVLRPVKFKMPFIVVGRAGCLDLFKKYGFKTFSNYWDESYDLEMNNEKRMLKIFTLIDSIDRYSITELKKMHDDMKDILEYNFDLLTYLHSKDSFILKNLYV
jgi:hypothetical protein